MVRWCSKALNRSCLLPAPSDARRLTPAGGHTCSALCRMRVRLGVVLLGLRPSLRWLRGSLSFSVRQLHRYYGAVRLLQNVHVRIMDLSPSRTGLLAQTLWRSPGSRAHCFLTCLDSSTTPSPAATRDLTQLAGCLPTDRKGSALGIRFSELNHPARQFLCLRFAVIPREFTGKTRGQNGVASPFP